MTDSLSNLAGLLPLCIAQVPSASESQMITVLLGGAALMVIANQAVIFWRSMTKSLRIEPPPAETYETLEHCRKTHDSINTKMDQMDQRSQATLAMIRKELLESISGVHRRVDIILDALALRNP